MIRVARGTHLPASLPCVVRATWAVSTSAPMHGFEAYVRHVDTTRVASPLLHAWPLPRDLHASLALPWASPRPPAHAEVYSALVSFVDDYSGAYPDAFFPEALVLDAHSLLRARCRELDARLAPHRQLESVAPLVAGSLFAGAVLLHALTRQLARGRDLRAMPSARFGSAPAARANEGAYIAAFPDALSRGGDPLGDTYHYWATFAVGAFTEATRASHPGASFALRTLFANGATLMYRIRQQLFGSHLFFGTHADVDALGLEDGTRIMRALLKERAGGFDG